MDYIRTTKALAVAAVVAMLVVVAVMPLADDLMDGEARAASGSNETPCLMSEAADGYTASITLTGTTTGGIPTATYDVDGHSRTISGSEALCWLTDSGTVLATASGLYTPMDPAGASEDVPVSIGEGSVTSGEDSVPYTILLAPSSSGTLGLYLEPFRATTMATVYMAAGQHVGCGPASAIAPMSDSDEGEYTATYTAGDGSVEVTGGSYAADGSTVQATAFVAPVEYYAGMEETEAGLASRIFSVVPVIILVGLAAFVAVTMGGRR